MVSWILIIAIIIILAILLFKLKEIRHKLLYGGIAVLAIFLLFSFGYVYLHSKVNLASYDGFVQVGQLYLGWLKAAASNFGSITSYAVKQEWGANLTNLSLG